MTDELKAMLKAAKTDEEAKEILLANKSELSDEELEKVNGGTGYTMLCVKPPKAEFNIFLETL